MTHGARGAVAGAVFGVFLIAWAFMAGGAGHGSYLPAGLVAAPISSVFRFGVVAAPVLWCLIGYAIARRWAAVGIVLLAVHVAGGTTNLVLGTPWEEPDRQWSQLRQVGVAVLVWPGFMTYLVVVSYAFARVLRQLGGDE